MLSGFEDSDDKCYTIFQLPFSKLFQFLPWKSQEWKRGFHSVVLIRLSGEKVEFYLSRHELVEAGIQIIIGTCFCGFFPGGSTQNFSHSLPFLRKRFIKVSFWVFNFVLIESFHRVPFYVCVGVYDGGTCGAEV